jgi:hypothetical protein
MRSEPSRRRRPWLLLALLIASPMALAGKISGVALHTDADRTSVVFDSEKKIRFTVFILRNPDRVVLELENTPLDASLAALAARIDAGHPHLKLIQIRPSPEVDGAVLLEFALRGEAEVETAVHQPDLAHGHRLVLDIVPQRPVPPSVPVPAPAAIAQAPVAAPPAQVLVPQPPLPPPPVVLATLVPRVAPAASAEATLTLLEVQLDGQMLADAITSYQHGGETLLPLGEMARLLTLAIRTQPAQGTASGFVLSEARTFSLNIAQARVTLAEQSQLFDPALVRVESDDIYVAASLLSRWLPLDLTLDMSLLTLRVRPRERLPLQDRLARENKDAPPARGAPADPGYPRQATPYRLLGVPAIDQTLGVGIARRDGQGASSASYSAYLTGDLLGMEAALYLASSKDKPSPDARFTLARHDPDAGLLGPMKARSLVFGSAVTMPGMPNVAASGPADKGLGVLLSNRPIHQPTSFDRHTLRGDLPPGWDVELFYNEALVGFRRASPDGRYSFDDLPLTYGTNEFRLVFHGPLGQQRVERHNFLLEQSSTPPGAFYYNLAHYRDSASAAHSTAQFEWGISKNLTMAGGLMRVPALAGGVDDADLLYSSLGLRSFLNGYIFSSDFIRSSGGGWLNETGVKTRIGGIALSYSRTQLKDFSSEVFLPNANALDTRNRLRLDGALPTPFKTRLPFTLEVQHDRMQAGPALTAVSGRISAHARQLSVSNQLSWQRRGADSTASGAIALSSRTGELGLVGQLGYSIAPDARLETITLSADKRLGPSYLLNLGLVRSVARRETLATVGLNKSLGSYGLGLSASYSSNGDIAAGLQLFIAMSREPRQARWRFDALPKADSGAASVRVFLDDNFNGIMDGAEEPLANVALTVNGSRAPLRTDAAGIALLDRLPVRQGVNIAVDTQTLEDPSWVPQRRGIRMVPRPGTVAELDFPVSMTSEIDGTVYLAEGNTRRGMGNVRIELLDLKMAVLSSIDSSSDGFYIIPAVDQGNYQVRISPAQIAEFGLLDPGMRAVSVKPDGKYINGIDFVLVRKTAPGVPPDEKK